MATGANNAVDKGAYLAFAISRDAVTCGDMRFRDVQYLPY
jgi:hypothetical protein